MLTKELLILAGTTSAKDGLMRLRLYHRYSHQVSMQVNPKFYCKLRLGANRAKRYQGGSRIPRLPP